MGEPYNDVFVETSISQKRPIPVSVLREEAVSKYPYWATRGLLMNSIMHKDFEGNAPIQFYEYDDRTVSRFKTLVDYMARSILIISQM
ncbi:hypothetical protein HR13_04520 [Porphyromonas gulae]|nr:hypothetical protein HR13_04520 [Porphyromonas gulae]